MIRPLDSYLHVCITLVKYSLWYEENTKVAEVFMYIIEYNVYSFLIYQKYFIVYYSWIYYCYLVFKSMMHFNLKK